ncbi:MAG: hypothetical protein HY360_08040 [Verrucomicrobia bacterium]|nr:hypothetical protein [Verrucomicrobiota bacterium]
MKEDRFDRIQRAIVHREAMSPPPHFEAGVGKDVREAYLGRPINSIQDDIDFWKEAGYCFYPVSFGLLQFGGKMATVGAQQHVGHAHYSLYRNEDIEMAWAETGTGVIASDGDFEKFVWPDPEKMSLSMLDEALPLLPHGMKVIANIGKIFTGTWQLMGFTFFSEAIHDHPQLVGRVFERVAEIQTRITERVIAHPAVGAVLHADDLAYFSGPMVNPVVLRRHVFPAYKRMGAMCSKRGVIYIYHSDGQMKDLIGDIVDCGFAGLHPIEPKPMDAVALKKQWGDRLCLLGHIDVDLLARGAPQQVREQTKRNLDLLARDGGYCPGSGNSVPDYVPLRNFVAMVETVKEWRS